MPRYEYKVVPAPSKGRKAKGVKTPEGRFALSVETVLNEMGAEGWEYLRAELLPSDERSGLTGSAVHWRNVLVFRRAQAGDIDAFAPEEIELPAPVHADPDIVPPAPISEPAADEPKFEGAVRMLKDNGVEEVSDVAGMTTALRMRAEAQGDEDGDGEDGGKR